MSSHVSKNGLLGSFILSCQLRFSLTELHHTCREVKETKYKTSFTTNITHAFSWLRWLKNTFSVWTNWMLGLTTMLVRKIIQYQTKLLHHTLMVGCGRVDQCSVVLWGAVSNTQHATSTVLDSVCSGGTWECENRSGEQLKSSGVTHGFFCVSEVYYHQWRSCKLLTELQHNVIQIILVFELAHGFY